MNIPRKVNYHEIKGLLSNGPLRVAPVHGGKQVANFWKVWTVGSEIYAVKRSMGTEAKISFHESGEIHYRISGQPRRLMSPPIPLPELAHLGEWKIAAEFRTLLSPGARLPVPEHFKKGKIIGIEVPAGHYKKMTLLIGASDSSLPENFAPIWLNRLRNGNIAAVVLQTFPLDEVNLNELKFIREELGLKINQSGPVTPKSYTEVSRYCWSPEGGNVILTIPMGTEVYDVAAAGPVGTPPKPNACAAGAR